MSLPNLSRALRAYSRNDTAHINCGGGWIVELKQFSTSFDTLRKVRAEKAAKGFIKKDKAVTPSAASQDTRLYEDNEIYFLGSLEADVAFFVDNVLVGWKGLKDDYEEEVPYSPEVAMALFTQTKAGEQLYSELLQSSLNASLFRVDIEAGEELVKN